MNANARTAALIRNWMVLVDTGRREDGGSASAWIFEVCWQDAGCRVSQIMAMAGCFHEGRDPAVARRAEGQVWRATPAPTVPGRSHECLLGSVGGAKVLVEVGEDAEAGGRWALREEAPTATAENCGDSAEAAGGWRQRGAAACVGAAAAAPGHRSGVRGRGRAAIGHGRGRRDEAPAEPGATGWRQFDWRGGAAEGAGAAEGQKDPGDEEYSLRVDFDEAACLAGPLSEYHAVFEAPAALRPPEPERRRINMKYKTIKIGPVEAPPSVSVLTHKGAPAESEAPPEISLACVAPSQGAGSVVSPVCRRVHPHVVVPLGGLVFVLPSEGGGQAVLWSPEEVHRLCMPQTKLELLVEEELRYYYAGTALPTQTTHLSRTTSKNYSPLLTTSIDGMVCIYRPTGDSSDIRIVDEGAGILRRECWDRAVGGQSPEESFDPKVQAGRVPNRTVECVVKPGTAVAVSAHLIDDSWYSAAKDGGGGVHLHQKLVPPGTPFLPGKPSLKSDKDWWVVELLQDPGSAEQGVCWLVVRPARLFEIPAAPEPAPPHTAKAASFWHVPFVNGEVVASLSPVALAHEVTLSIGRSPSEPHCVTAALDESGPAGAGSGRPAAADPRRPAAAGVGPQRKPGGARLTLIRDSVQGASDSCSTRRWAPRPAAAFWAAGRRRLPATRTSRGAQAPRGRPRRVRGRCPSGRCRARRTDWSAVRMWARETRRWS
ncbi:unnamed protein product [Prorocentrum cordatum]|uniref:Uncharacterized protein n=1 Tax=Prorocentrum cordatum TaxID=2364126 RepID=A0ABN9UE19_9DINO|nr:unnamed protein product [Polarella glacialis]